MNELIGQALFLNECEFAVLMGAGGGRTFTGFRLSEHSLENEGRFEGINSLIKRKILKNKAESYVIADEYADMLHCLIRPSRAYNVSDGKAMIYCADNTVFVRSVNSEPARFSICRADHRMLAQTFADYCMLPESDESAFMAEHLPAPGNAEEFAQRNDKLIMISGVETAELLAVMRVGLCMALITACGGAFGYEVYSRKRFETKLEELLEGRLTVNDNH